MSEFENLNAKMIPENFGPLKDKDSFYSYTGPCGDTMSFWMKFDEKIVKQATYITDGCGASILCGSVAASLCLNKTLEEVLKMKPEEITNAIPDFPEDDEHCALLAMTVVWGCVQIYQNQSCDQNCSSCSVESCSEDKRNTKEKVSKRENPIAEERNERDGLNQVKHKFAVLSGKGGVGKSTVTVNLAGHLCMEGYSVGILDADIHGPSIPVLLGIEDEKIMSRMGKLIPVEVGGIKVISVGLLLNQKDDAVVWRGPMKYGVIEQMLLDTDWGEVDFLILDLPPGTGDEALGAAQLVKDLSGAVLVTTPQKVAGADVRRTVRFCEQLQVKPLGIIENMSGHKCSKCGEIDSLFGEGEGQKIAKEYELSFLGKIPLDQEIRKSGDMGQSYLRSHYKSDGAAEFRSITNKLIEIME